MSYFLLFLSWVGCALVSGIITAILEFGTKISEKRLILVKSLMTGTISTVFLFLLLQMLFVRADVILIGVLSLIYGAGQFWYHLKKGSTMGKRIGNIINRH